MRKAEPYERTCSGRTLISFAHRMGIKIKSLTSFTIINSSGLDVMAYDLEFDGGHVGGTRVCAVESEPIQNIVKIFVIPSEDPLPVNFGSRIMLTIIWNT